MLQVVWFKRDLRIEDHAPLTEAAACGPCVLLYVYEPEVLGSPYFDASHLQFINESLVELDAALRRRGGRLVRRMGRVPEVFEELHQAYGVAGLWSHEETGDRASFDRDRRVARWAADRGVRWREFPQTGVVRRLRSRDGWSRRRESWLKERPSSPPRKFAPTPLIEGCGEVGPLEAGLQPTSKTELPRGGETAGRVALQSFLEERGERYRSEMSSPVTAWSSCSRISPYLTWGCISMRTVVQALQERQRELRAAKHSGVAVGGWLQSLKSFESRLSWRCHFMQKLEDEPEIEFRNMSRIYDGLREDAFDLRRFEAWRAGQTGYPLVDACMRALLQHSWINFRMRAMLVSFASYHLWLHWRPTASFLARHFLDFEPGIHFSQFQMQSGTTGINTVRIYSPIKQVQDQDPQGEFIRRYVPELADVPAEHLAEPHRMPLAMQSRVGCQIGENYPPPIVDHATAYRSARERIFAVRKQCEAKEEALRVLRKHGSRKSPTRRRA